MSRKSKQPEKTTIRCAIYTRKSSEEGLDQEYNSLDAQRDAAEAYIASQKAEGWTALPDRYDDGGFTGGNMERPALDRMLRDIEQGKIDCVVVYKVDRLSRSLMDFSRILEVFERHGVSFVSVTQHFNTTHSMGRLTLNILLSFAQFEREIIGERIRDNLVVGRYANVEARNLVHACVDRIDIFPFEKRGVLYLPPDAHACFTREISRRVHHGDPKGGVKAKGEA